MPPISLLIKPASGHCDMRCQYCFYADEVSKRETALHPIMDKVTLTHVIQKALAHAERECFIGFQGGEPTLAGLDFFQQVVALQKEYNVHHVKIQNSIQTNGLRLDERWARFFKENDFLVGVSIDGPSVNHDQHRLDQAGKGTWNKIMHGITLLKRYDVAYNVLCVITAQSARNIQKIYRFFMSNGFIYQQYIPCLDPLGEPRGQRPYSLTPSAYARFLITLFDLWYTDVMAGKFVYIRYFENLAGILRGFPPESCGLAGRCTNQHVVEADGSVYPCDFYMLDPFCIGNLRTDSFADIQEAFRSSGFVEASLQPHPACPDCQWHRICHGGCRRDRQDIEIDSISKNYYCEAYKLFFAHAIPKLVELLRRNAHLSPA